MKPQPQSSTQEVLAGLVERVTFHNTENGFCVLRAKARGHRDLVTVVGHAAKWAQDQKNWWVKGEDPTKGLAVRFDERTNATWAHDANGNPHRSSSGRC
jgi:hypothetical protein